jgi:hypothetical protein
MLVTGRQAARSLREVLSSDEQGRLLLRTGLAGPGVSTTTGLLFDADAVDEVRLRPVVDLRDLAVACPWGLYVARLPRTAALELTEPWRAVADQVIQVLSGQRKMTALSSALTTVRITAWTSLPFVATFLGYVVLTADLIGLGESGPVLAPPGDWSRLMDRRRFPTPPGGRPSYVWLPAPGPPGC